MFQFSACPLPGLCVQPGVPGHSSWRVAPFGNPRIECSLAATRGLSQQRYVLHRLLVPRHPPCALSSLTFLPSLFSDGAEDIDDVSQRHQTRCVSPGLFVRIHNLALDRKNPAPFSRRLAISLSRCGDRRGFAAGRMAMNASAGLDAPRAWWRWPGSNRRPPACKAGALPAELHPRRVGG